MIALIRRQPHKPQKLVIRKKLTGAAVADEDELEAGVVHRLLVGERLKGGNKDNGREREEGDKDEIAAKRAAAAEGMITIGGGLRLPCVGEIRPRSISNAGSV